METWLSRSSSWGRSWDSSFLSTLLKDLGRLTVWLILWKILRLRKRPPIMNSLIPLNVLSTEAIMVEWQRSIPFFLLPYTKGVTSEGRENIPPFFHKKAIRCIVYFILLSKWRVSLFLSFISKFLSIHHFEWYCIWQHLKCHLSPTLVNFSLFLTDQPNWKRDSIVDQRFPFIIWTLCPDNMPWQHLISLKNRVSFQIRKWTVNKSWCLLSKLNCIGREDWVCLSNFLENAPVTRLFWNNYFKVCICKLFLTNLFAKKTKHTLLIYKRENLTNVFLG